MWVEEDVIIGLLRVRASVTLVAAKTDNNKLPLAVPTAERKTVELIRDTVAKNTRTERRDEKKCVHTNTF
jgi:hypothetical protein